MISLKKKIRYVVKSVVNLNKDITSIEMAPVGNRFTFKSGQFVFVSFKDSFIGEESHPFSIASGENDLNFKLVIKSFGDFTNRLKELKPGTAVDVEGPYGNFSCKSISNKKQIWIAGGIGITPFMSMAYSLDDTYEVDLYCCVKEKGEAVLLNELLKISEIKKNFKVILWCSNDSGFINSEVIANKSDKFGDKDIFMCGPVVFMNSLNQQFLSLKVAKDKIHYENFNFFS
jgi:predicted ferric reductase